jgi:hypothetical protein
MCPPLRQIRRDNVDDLLLEIESEVVTGSEVGEPLVAHPDHPAVDLLDDRVGHRIGPFERGQVVTGGKPLVDPGKRGRRRLSARGRARSHPLGIDRSRGRL